MKWVFIFIIGIAFLFGSCSNNNDFDSIIASNYEKCPNPNSCIIDFSNSMKFEWDTMYYFSAANSLEDINKELGFELKGFTDIGDRVIFINKDEVVYQKEWFPNPSEPLEGVVFETDLKIFKAERSNAKFKIKKEGKAFYLEKQ